MDIIRCGTINGVELLGIRDITGSLEECTCADIAVVNGDPLVG
jgi:imidazolonepropionase-like amidohydrolase